MEVAVITGHKTLQTLRAEWPVLKRYTPLKGMALT